MEISLRLLVNPRAVVIYCEQAKKNATKKWLNGAKFTWYHLCVQLLPRQWRRVSCCCATIDEADRRERSTEIVAIESRRKPRARSVRGKTRKTRRWWRYERRKEKRGGKEERATWKCREHESAEWEHEEAVEGPLRSELQVNLILDDSRSPLKYLVNRFRSSTLS